MKQALKQLYTYPLQSFLITLALALGIAVIVAVYTVININANSDDSLWQRELILQDAQIAPSKKQVPLRKITDNNKEILTFSEVDLMAVKKSVPNLDYGYIEVEWKLNLAK